MRKRKLSFLQLRLLVLPIALAIGSGSAHAARIDTDFPSGWTSSTAKVTVDEKEVVYPVWTNNGISASIDRTTNYGQSIFVSAPMGLPSGIYSGSFDLDVKLSDYSVTNGTSDNEVINIYFAKSYSQPSDLEDNKKVLKIKSIELAITADAQSAESFSGIALGEGYKYIIIEVPYSNASCSGLSISNFVLDDGNDYTPVATNFANGSNWTTAGATGWTLDPEAQTAYNNRKNNQNNAYLIGDLGIVDEGNYLLSFGLKGVPYNGVDGKEYITVYFTNSADPSELKSEGVYTLNLIDDCSKIFNVSKDSESTSGSLVSEVTLVKAYKYIIIEVYGQPYACAGLTISNLALAKQLVVVEEGVDAPTGTARYAAGLTANTLPAEWTVNGEPSWVATADAADGACSQMTDDVETTLNNWLVSAPVRLAANSNYEVYFQVRADQVNKLAVYANTSRDFSKSKPYIQKNALKTEGYVWLSFNVNTSAEAYYYIGFNCTSAPLCELYVKNLQIYGPDIAGTAINESNPYASNLFTKNVIDSGWRVVDVNQDAKTWKGAGNWSNGAMYTYNEKRAADDWMISPAFALVEGKKYKISFTAKAGSCQEKLGVYIAGAGYVESLASTAPIGDFTFAPNYNKEESIEFTVPSSGNYYIGLYAHSDADQYTLTLSGFKLEEVVEVVEVPVDPFVVTAATPYKVTIAEDKTTFAEGWKTNDSNDDGLTWKVDYRLYANYHSVSVAGDDWLLSRRVTLKSGQKYVVNMTMKAFNETFGSGVLDVYVEKGLDVAAFEGKDAKYTAPALTASDAVYSFTFTAAEDGDYVIGFHAGGSAPVSIAIKDVAVEEARDIATAALPGNIGYSVTGNTGEVPAAALEDTTARVFDATEVEVPLEINPANPNAYVIGGSNITTTANKLVKDAEGNLSADAISINADNAFHFGYDVTCPVVSFTRKCLSTDTYVTAVLPFDVTVQPGMSKINGFNGDNTAVVFNSITGNTVPAYTPFMYRKGDVEKFIFNGANVEAKAGSGLMIQDVEGSSWKQAFVFSETVIENVTTDPTLQEYYVYAFSEGKFWLVTGKMILKPFRAIYLLEKGSGVAAPSLRLLIDDDVPTGLEEMYYNDAAANEAPAYNEAGIRVNEGYKGITIRNGKKTIRK